MNNAGQSLTDRQTAVTVFKGIAILMVVLVHIAQPFSLPQWMEYVPRLGQLGCQIFLVLSAYTLCLSLERDAKTYFTFQKKRWLRIVPGYWSMIVIYLLLGGLSLLLLNKNVFGTSTNWAHIVINFFLLNGLVPGQSNNLVVRGGWYVGTSIILYLLMPLLYRIYQHKAEKWQKVRIWLFPLMVTVCSATVIIVAASIDSRFYCANNSFVYFSFVNQLSSFSIGFSLFDWKRNSRKMNKHILTVLCASLGVVSVLMFYSDVEHIFAIVPSVFSSFFACLFAVTSAKIEKNSLKTTLMQKWGKHSYSIYLVHSLIVYEGSKLVIHLWKVVFPNVSQGIIFIIWLPIAYVIIYGVGILFTKYLSVWNKLLEKRRQKYGS